MIFAVFEYLENFISGIFQMGPARTPALPIKIWIRHASTDGHAFLFLDAPPAGKMPAAHFSFV
jgi:hypothetical protein